MINTTSKQDIVDYSLPYIQRIHDSNFIELVNILPEIETELIHLIFQYRLVIISKDWLRLYNHRLIQTVVPELRLELNVSNEFEFTHYHDSSNVEVFNYSQFEIIKKTIKINEVVKIKQYLNDKIKLNNECDQFWKRQNDRVFTEE